MAHLSLEALLDELLIRVRDLFEADTAAVLLLDPLRKELVATAAKGIESEVEQGVRLPLGEGFAGKIAATGRPVVLPVVEHGKVLNPLLLERGIKSMAGVPLVVDGGVIGVMHVGTLVPRAFSDEDVDLLQVVADRVALAVHARRVESQRVIAETLQRSLLPDRLPALHNIEISVRYAPAHGGMIGGDWYDVFQLPSGLLAIVIGDIVGRGLDAAVQMGRLRSALRALTLVATDPANVLTMLNDHVLHFEQGVLGSVLYGTVRPDGTVVYANAGHMPPIVIDDHREAVFVDAGETIIGAAPNARYRNNEIKLRHGSTLLLYTDGLVERRGVSLEVGLEQLRTAVADDSWHTLDELCALALPTDQPLEDDLAALWLRFGPPARRDRLELKLRSDPRVLSSLRRAMRTWFDAIGVGGQDAGDVMLSVGEAAANSIEHAYGPAGGMIFIEGGIDEQTIEVVVRDRGQWRDPRGDNRGRGRLLMSELMDDVSVDATREGTTVTLRKRIGGDTP